MYRFLPLIFITLLVLSFAGTHLLWLQGDFYTFMKYFMAGYFLIFGLLKVSNWSAFTESYKKYDWAASRSNIYAYTYPGLEVLLGIAYYIDVFPVLLNIFVFILMIEKGLSVYMSIQAKKISKCACLGGWFSIPITHITVFEDLLMAAMALFMLLLHT
ncbi:MAG: hypothetical protein ACI9SY_000421 [Candidatus Paceibacteria bacterium]|jgi:hypothetical protein